MPWSQMSPMDQKTQFIADYLRQSLSVTELCEHYGISRKSGYKWIERLRARGSHRLGRALSAPARMPNPDPQGDCGGTH
ncbi:MAG: helix-turn-helix domain-containing protein [Gammaproteobacteria bacterium]